LGVPDLASGLAHENEESSVAILENAPHRDASSSQWPRQSVVIVLALASVDLDFDVIRVAENVTEAFRGHKG
jgi:hypothetical protein